MNKEYRFGFQNQEKDDEWTGQTGSNLNFKYRMYDARIGRFFAIDPLASKYPYNSTYAFSENRVIDGVELEGLEYVSTKTLENNPSNGATMSYNSENDSYNIDFGNGIEFSNVNTVDWNNQTYFNLGTHLYNDGETISKTGSEENKITEWAYTLIPPVIKPENFVGYDSKRPTGCYDNCVQSINKQGFQLDKNSQIQVVTKDGIQTLNAIAAIDFINRSLEAGRPVMVGIDINTDITEYNEGLTDHWITLVARGSEDGIGFFGFYENAVPDARRGTNLNRNRLVVNRNGWLIGNTIWGSDKVKIYLPTRVLGTK